MKTKFAKTLQICLLLYYWAVLSSFINAPTLNQRSGDSVQYKALDILKHKCNVCHRSRNPSKVFTFENMNVLAPKIYQQVFIRKRMPKGKSIRLTSNERELLRNWLETQKLNEY